MNAHEREALRLDLARLAEGDRAALQPAFTRLQPLVLRFCLRLLDPQAAEDATQDALVRLFSHTSSYDDSRDPVPWALAFASNACRTIRRREGRRREEPGPPDLPSTAPSPESTLLDAELRAAVRATLSELSPPDAETLALAMGERPNSPTFRKRLERASARFRAAWRLR